MIKNQFLKSTLAKKQVLGSCQKYKQITGMMFWPEWDSIGVVEGRIGSLFLWGVKTACHNSSSGITRPSYRILTKEELFFNRVRRQKFVYFLSREIRDGSFSCWKLLNTLAEMDWQWHNCCTTSSADCSGTKSEVEKTVQIYTFSCFWHVMFLDSSSIYYILHLFGGVTTENCVNVTRNVEWLSITEYCCHFSKNLQDVYWKSDYHKKVIIYTFNFFNNFLWDQFYKEKMSLNWRND